MNNCIIVSVIFLVLLAAVPVSAKDDPLTSAGALYSQSVDLANAGKYEQALQKADQALAMNVTAINHLIQANRAGILVVLGRYDEAVTAADAALAVQGNLTATHAAAYYNKGDALRHLGRTDEANVAFEKAHALDNTLTPPGPLLPGPTHLPTKTPSPSPLVVTGCVAAGILLFVFSRKQ
jgi:tetratricopeptide (TPR) repeat protein